MKMPKLMASDMIEILWAARHVGSPFPRKARFTETSVCPHPFSMKYFETSQGSFMHLSFVADKARYIIFSFLLCCSFFQIASAQNDFVEDQVFVYFGGCDLANMDFEDAITPWEKNSGYKRLKKFPHLGIALYQLPS